MKKRIILLMMTLISFACTTLAQDITGTWEFVQNNNKCIVTYASGNKMTLKFHINESGCAAEFTVKGTYKNNYKALIQEISPNTIQCTKLKLENVELTPAQMNVLKTELKKTFASAAPAFNLHGQITYYSQEKFFFRDTGKTLIVMKRVK